jgi:hypothetical protein
MENLSDSDAKLLPGFGPGEGLISGQAVKFPLLVKIDFDEELKNTSIGDDDFLKEASEWKPDAAALSRSQLAAVAAKLEQHPRVKKAAKA